ncbi:MAG: hypothetical protein ABIJ97_13255 [Bacteroidota bacterium]
MEQENLRTVEVELNKNSFKGFFHGWTNRRNEDMEGKEYTYMLAVVENSETGEVIEVDPEKIHFSDR